MENSKEDERLNLPDDGEPTPAAPDQPGPDNTTADQEPNSERNERDSSAEESRQPDLQSMKDEPSPPVAAPAQPDTESVATTPASDLEQEKTAAQIRSQGGRDAHYKGQLTAAVLGKAVGAKRLGKFSNHHQLDGEHFQIRTISGSQNTFTVNVDTEPPQILVLQKDPGEDRNDSRFLLFGILRDDAIRVSLPSSSKGHVDSGHRQVSLSKVPKTALGEVFIPGELVAAKKSRERQDLLAKIDVLTPEVVADVLTDMAAVEHFIVGKPPAELCTSFALDCLDEAIELVRSMRAESNPWTLIDATLETLEDAQASLRGLYPRGTTSGAKLPLDESEGNTT